MLTKSKNSKAALIGGVALFSACNSREIARIAALADEVEVPQGRVLTQEGHIGGEFFVIAEGTAEATLRGQHLAWLKEGSFFGEMSLLDHGPRAATVTAMTPMRLLVLEPRSFLALLEEVPSVSRKISRGLAERLRESEQAPTH